MTKLPEYVYLITVDSEWPVSAIAGDHPSVPELIEAEIQRRCQSQNVPNRGYVHVWRVPVQLACSAASSTAWDATEMELLPAAVVKPSLREKPPPAAEEDERARVRRKEGKR
jgi:hypothetical protein